MKGHTVNIPRGADAEKLAGGGRAQQWKTVSLQQVVSGNRHLTLVSGTKEKDTRRGIVKRREREGRQISRINGG